MVDVSMPAPISLVVALSILDASEAISVLDSACHAQLSHSSNLPADA